MFVGKRPSGYSDELEEEKRMRMFVGKRPSVYSEYPDELEEEKRMRMFVGKRTGDDLAELASALADAANKRARYFVGKKDDDMSYLDSDEKRARMFVGKKLAPSFIGKKRAPGFIGRRGAPGFVGKRVRMFVGKRDSYDLVKRSTPSSDNEDNSPIPRVDAAKSVNDINAKTASDMTSNTNVSQENSSQH